MKRKLNITLGGILVLTLVLNIILFSAFYKTNKTFAEIKNQLDDGKIQVKSAEIEYKTLQTNLDTAKKENVRLVALKAAKAAQIATTQSTNSGSSQQSQAPAPVRHTTQSSDSDSGNNNSGTTRHSSSNSNGDSGSSSHAVSTPSQPSAKSSTGNDGWNNAADGAVGGGTQKDSSFNMSDH